MARKAYIYVINFGDAEQVAELAKKINDQTLFYARVMSCGKVLIQIRLYEIGQFFDVMASNDEFNWIEFTVQVES